MPIVQYLGEYHRWCNVFGIMLLMMLLVSISRNRRMIVWRQIIRACVLYVGMAVMLLHSSIGTVGIASLARGVVTLYQAADAGIVFLFGNLADATGPWGFIFAIRVLPMILFFGALMNILFVWGIVTRIVLVLNRIIRPIVGTTGPETACAVANSFLGQTEAPLLIRHYLPTMTRSELYVVMGSGMATLSGPALMVYASWGIPVDHLLISSLLAIPAVIIIAKIVEPESERSMHGASEQLDIGDLASGTTLHAITRGTADGLTLALNVGAMLITFTALVAVSNGILWSLLHVVQYCCSILQSECSIPIITLQQIFAWCSMPILWLLGLRGGDAYIGAELLGVKVIINEMVAYQSLVHAMVSPRALVIITYLLAGFANISSIGIQVGGIGALIPERREVLIALGWRAVLCGTCANILSAMLVGLLL